MFPPLVLFYLMRITLLPVTLFSQQEVETNDSSYKYIDVKCNSAVVWTWRWHRGCWDQLRVQEKRRELPQCCRPLQHHHPGSVGYTINQSVSQSISQSVNQSINQSSISQSINQSISLYSTFHQVSVVQCASQNTTNTNVDKEVR